jgi:hypothetical protein
MPYDMNPESRVTRRLYDPDEDVELATVIVYALADALGVSPSELTSPTLYECVDVESLEIALFGDGSADRTRQTSGAVSFQYVESIVNIHGNGLVEVYGSPSPDTVDEFARS